MSQNMECSDALEPKGQPTPHELIELREIVDGLVNRAGTALFTEPPPDALALLIQEPECAALKESSDRTLLLEALPKDLSARTESGDGKANLLPAIGNEDVGASELHGEAAEAYRRSNVAYQSLQKPKYPFITIESGRRTTARQFELYSSFIWWKFFGGQPKSNPADIPGRSIHEYGFAIDIVHKADSHRLKAALEANQWKATHAGEPWHYDAVGVPSWSRLRAFIAGTATTSSDELVEHLMAMFKARKLYESNKPDYEKKRKKIKPELDKLEKERRELAQRADRLLREQRRLQAEHTWITDSRRRLEDLRRKLQQMVYTSCPSGQTYANCTHSALKQQYDREKAELSRKVTDLAHEVSARQQKYSQDIAAHRASVDQYDREKRIFDGKVDELRAKNAAFFRLHDQMVKWKQEFSDEELHVNRLVSTVAAIVRSFG